MENPTGYRNENMDAGIAAYFIMGACERGDVSVAAYSMCHQGYMCSELAQKYIERGIGGRAWAAYMMCRNGHSTPEWARCQIELCEDIEQPVSWMVADGYATEEWKESVLNKLKGVK